MVVKYSSLYQLWKERPLALHELVEDGQHLTGNVQLLTKVDPVIVFPSNKNI